MSATRQVGVSSGQGVVFFEVAMWAPAGGKFSSTAHADAAGVAAGYRALSNGHHPPGLPRQAVV